MIKTGTSEVNVDQLMDKIREEVSWRKSEGSAHASQSSFAASTGRSDKSLRAEEQVQLSGLNLEPEFRLQNDHHYHINDLLKYHDKYFVRNAYRAILKREPDEAGHIHHLHNLRSGRFNKVDVLASLRSSPEGKSKRVKIDGLAWPAAIRRAGRAPFIGYLIQLTIGLMRLPVLLRNFRELESYLISQQQEITGYINQSHAQLTNHVSGLSISLDRLAQELHVIRTERRQIESQLQQVESLLQQQQREIIETQNGIKQQLNNEIQQVTDKIDTQQLELQDFVKHQIQRINEEREKQEKEALRKDKEISQKLQQTRTELVMQERRVSLLLEEARKRLPAPFDERHVEAFAEQENHFHDALYVSLEDQFRGSREEIKRRLRYYLPFIKEAGITKDILDVGCGRGEWLEVLREEGLSGLGVDVNHVLVEQCRQMGLEVIKEDAIDYLRRLPDNSLRAVTSFHVIEHLPFRFLMKLLDEIVRTLKPGGVLILETPNPENVLVGSCNFYLDPTHRNPLPNQLVHFLLESRGLCRLQTIKLQPWDEAKVAGDTELAARFNEYFYGPMDYAVMGWKV